MRYKVKRWLRWYDRRTDELLGQIKLNMPLYQLQSLFSVRDPNPVFDSFIVNQDHAEMLEKWVRQAINLVDYEYVVEADAG